MGLHSDLTLYCITGYKIIYTISENSHTFSMLFSARGYEMTRSNGGN